MKQTQNIKCSGCGSDFSADIHTLIDVQKEPELKAAAISGELFVKECPHCSKKQILRYPLIYIDREAKLLLCLSDTALHIENLEGMTARLVPDAGSLIEKIKISDAGLDDAAVEMCKFVTLKELGKEVVLRFLRTDGAEGDLVFAYPEKDEMQMLAVGLNVYEDCNRILQRNTAMKESASSGLVQVDADWLAGFLA